MLEWTYITIEFFQMNYLMKDHIDITVMQLIFNKLKNLLVLTTLKI